MTTSRHRLIRIPSVVDERGCLLFAQESDHVPFVIRRIFVLEGMPAGSKRGGHAHRVQHQFLMMLKGACTVTVDDGRERLCVRLDRPDLALYAPPLHWLDLTEFTPNAICATLVSERYDESDYIRNAAEFRRLAAGG